MKIKRFNSSDNGYWPGMLSVFPRAKDSKLTLYEAVNNAETTLKQTLSINGKYIILHDASRFPSSGLVKMSDKAGDTEIIFYGKKIGNQLHDLHRGFNDNKQFTWKAGSQASCPVMAEHNNAIRDAILKIQGKIGSLKNPKDDTILGMLDRLERKWLAPKPVFRAYPRQGKSPLTVHFHNFSNGKEAKFLWEFGDGSTSTEVNPNHTYLEGTYTVKLSMMSSQGNQAVAEKSNYITAGTVNDLPYFYAEPSEGTSVESANAQNIANSVFTFIDQTEGSIFERHWHFGDGKDVSIKNPQIHTAKHIYDKPGAYKPFLIIHMENGTVVRPLLIREVRVL